MKKHMTKRDKQNFAISVIHVAVYNGMGDKPYLYCSINKYFEKYCSDFKEPLFLETFTHMMYNDIMNQYHCYWTIDLQLWMVYEYAKKYNFTIWDFIS